MIDPDLLLQGYRLGVFPMAMNDDLIEWFSPDPRAVVPLDNFHVPHALRRLLRRKPFEITIDKAFSAVIQACAERESTWTSSTATRDYMNSVTLIQSRLGKKTNLPAGFTVSQSAARFLANQCFIA
jgi:leucyl/phenylalanyl-tRNA--protein transferase